MTDNDIMEKEEMVIASDEGNTIFFSPAGIIMMFVAGFVDFSEILVGIIPVVGLFFSIVIDILAIVIIGGWIYFRSVILKVPGRTGMKIGKAAKWAKKMKWLRPLCIIMECIPVVGWLPLWILLVYFELKHA